MLIYQRVTKRIHRGVSQNGGDPQFLARLMGKITGWWLSPTPLKNMKVNGKDYPIYYGK